jgi:hypothetical protein
VDQRVRRWTAVRLDDAAVGEQLAGVIEDDYTIAEEAPALLRHRDHDAGRVSVGVLGGGAVRLVLAQHRESPVRFVRRLSRVIRR